MPNNGDVDPAEAQASADAELKAHPVQPVTPGQYGAVYIPPGYDADDGKPVAPPADHSDFPDEPYKDGTKHTYYGYKGDVDGDSASRAGHGDAGWAARGGAPLVPHYDVALTPSKRIKLFGGDGKTSTGKEFAQDGKTYRDSDTAPEADDRIDEYAPDHPPDPPGTQSYYASAKAKVQGKAPIQQWKEDHPDLSKYSDEQIVAAIKPKVAPNMSDDDFRQAAYSPTGAVAIQQAFQKLPLLTQARMDHPEYKDWDDDKLVKAMYGSMQKQGITDGMTFEMFQAKLNPPNPVMTTIANTLKSFGDMAQGAIKAVGTQGQDRSDPWAQIANEYGQMFSEAAGVAHESAAGFYGAVNGFKQGMSNLSPLKIADQIAQKVGINSNVQDAYDKFTQQYLRTPFDQYFRRGISFLNDKAEQQRQAAAANFEKAKNLNPVLKLSADIGGSIPEMAATFGAGYEAKLATKAESIGRMLWSTMYQASADNGKAVEATAKKQFLQQARAGFTTALQTYLFNSPYGRIQTGLLNALLGANDNDLHAWIQGRPNRIDDKIQPAIVNFALGYMWGHSDLDPAANADVEASRKALDQGNADEAKRMIDRAFAMMPEDDQQQHARNFITLTDILADNTLRGDALKTRRIETALTEPADLADFRLRQDSNMAEVHFDPDESLSQPYERQAEVVDPDFDLKNATSYAPMSADTPERMAEESALEKPPGNPEPPKAQPLDKTDVQRFTRSYFYNKRSQLGASINPAEPLIWGAKKTKKALEPISEFGHEIHKVLDAGEYGPKAKEAEAEVGKANAQNQMAQAAYLNQKFRELSSPDMVQDLDLYSKRQNHFKKYSQAQLKGILMKMEAGESTGDPVIDEMKKVYDQINTEFAQMENDNGITFDLRDNYLMHAWKADKDTKEQWFKSHSKSFADPSFMKPRDIQTLAQGFSIGKELRSYSPEDLHQGRAYDHFKAMSKVDMLESWHEQGNAFKTTEKDLPEGVDMWPPIRSPKRQGEKGTTYYVHPEKAIVVKRAWDPMFDNPAAQKIVGGAIHALKQMKAVTVPFRLGFSAAHAAHIPMIRAATRFSYLSRDRMLDAPHEGAASWWKALVDAPTLGISRVAMDVGENKNVVAAMQGQYDLRNLTETEQRNVKDLLDAGFSAGFTDRQRGIIEDGIRRMMPSMKALGAWNKISELGHKTLSHINFQHYVFSTMIPSVKVAHVLERIGDLYRAKPELLDAANEASRLQELRKITQAADRKFGEMFYDNMFTAKWVKNLGIGVFLSQAWQLGLVDYAGGLVDLGANPIKMAMATNKAREQAGGAMRGTFTDRLLSSYFYTAISMAMGAMITYLNMASKPGGNQHQFGWMDMFFPWSGKQPNGEDKRYRTMNFPGELLSIGHHMGTEGVVGGLSHTVQNKYSGLMASVIQSIQNTNYIGNKISDADFYTLQGVYDRLNYVFNNSVLPIGYEQYVGVANAPQAHKAEAAQDAVAAFLGLNQAPMWTGRTKLANDIIQARHNEKGSGGGQSAEQQAKWEKLDAIRDSINYGTHEQTVSAIHAALKAGVTKEAIHNLKKNIHVSTDKTAFKAMSTEGQLKFLKGMDHEQRKAYWPYAHEKARLLLKTKS
jgi:hypothetical protein